MKPLPANVYWALEDLFAEFIWFEEPGDFVTDKHCNYGASSLSEAVAWHNQQVQRLRQRIEDIIDTALNPPPALPGIELPDPPDPPTVRVVAERVE